MARAANVLAQMRDLPLARLEEITNGETIMVLAPHPDDESLGCGGLIAQACALGQPPVVTILTDGTGSHPSSPSYPSCRLRYLREYEARQAVATLGLPPDRIHFLGFRDTAAPKSGPDFDCAVTGIVRLMRAYDCRMLCAPWLYEPHGDHEAAQLIARSAARITKAQLLSYLVWGWTLAPDTVLPGRQVDGWRLGICDQLALKRRAIAAHVSQYTDLINDDPNGFRLPPKLLSAITNCPYEVLLGSDG
jgi:LmbE family N-acetylglucosaminyl deacetylase